MPAFEVRKYQSPSSPRLADGQAGAGEPARAVGGREIGDLRPGAGLLLPDRGIGDVEVEIAVRTEHRIRRAGAGVPGGAVDALRAGEIAAEGPDRRAGLFVHIALVGAKEPVADRAEHRARNANAAVPGRAVRAVDVELEFPGAGDLAVDARIRGAEVPVAVLAERRRRQAGAGEPARAVGAGKIGDLRPGAGLLAPDRRIGGVEIEIAVRAERRIRRAGADVPALPAGALRGQGDADRDGVRFEAGGRDRARRRRCTCRRAAPRSRAAMT